MQERTFTLGDHDYIELNKLLKLLGLAETGGDANNIIDAGMVIVNGEVETRRRNKLRAGYVVEFEGVVVKIV